MQRAGHPDGRGWQPAAAADPRHGQTGGRRAQLQLRHWPYLHFPRERLHGRRAAGARQPAILHQAGPTHHQRPAPEHGRRPGVSGRHAAAPLWRRGSAGHLLCRHGGLLPAPRPQLGALRHGQGAGTGAPVRTRGRARRDAAPLRVSPLYRLWRHRRPASDEGDDRRRGASQGARGQHQAGGRRHSRSGVYRPGVAAHSRRPRARPAGAPPARSAGRHRPVRRPRGEPLRSLADGLSLPAPGRKYPAGDRRSADSDPAHRRAGSPAAACRPRFCRLDRFYGPSRWGDGRRPSAVCCRGGGREGGPRPSRATLARSLAHRTRRYRAGKTADRAGGGRTGTALHRPAALQRGVQAPSGGPAGAHRPGLADAGAAAAGGGQPWARPPVWAGVRTADPHLHPQRLSAAAGGEPGRPAPTGAAVRREWFGKRTAGPLPHPAGRAARPAAPLSPHSARSVQAPTAPVPAAHPRGGRGAADGGAAPVQAGAAAAYRGGRHRRRPAADEGERPPHLAGGGDYRRSGQSGLGPDERALRRAARGSHQRPARLCRGGLRQARRYRAGLRLGSRSGVPARRQSQRLYRRTQVHRQPPVLPASGPTDPAPVQHPHPFRHPVWDRHAAAPLRRLRAAGFVALRLWAIPAKRGLDLGASGPGARPPHLWRRGGHRRICPHPSHRAGQGAGSADPGPRGAWDAPEDAGSPAQGRRGGVRPQAVPRRHGGHRVYRTVSGAGPRLWRTRGAHSLVR